MAQAEVVAGLRPDLYHALEQVYEAGHSTGEPFARKLSWARDNLKRQEASALAEASEDGFHPTGSAIP